MKALAVVLASSLLLLILVPIANAQQGSYSGSENGFIEMNGFSSGRTYIIYLTWSPNNAKGNVFDIFIHDSETGKMIQQATYDISIYKDGRSITSLQRMDQTSTRQIYDFKDPGQYTMIIDNINGSKERIDFSMQVTPEFPLGLFTGMAALFASVAAVHRFRHRIMA